MCEYDTCTEYTCDCDCALRVGAAVGCDRRADCIALYEMGYEYAIDPDITCT